MMERRAIGIFIPVYHRENLVKPSLKSLLNTVKESSATEYYLDLHVFVGINGADESLSNFLSNEIRDLFSRANIRYFKVTHPKNFGKPTSVNILVDIAVDEVSDWYHQQSIDRGLDYIVSYDSDMVVEDPEWLLKMVEIFERYTPSWGQAKLGALSANQSVKCCHVLDKDPFVIEFGNYHLVHRAGNEGTAGGVLFTSTHIWNTVGGYHAHRLYASDDGHFMLACAQLGLICPVVREVSFIHPHENDTAYLDWKVRACQDRLLSHELEGYWK